MNRSKRKCFIYYFSHVICGKKDTVADKCCEAVSPIKLWQRWKKKNIPQTVPAWRPVLELSILSDESRSNNMK